MLKNPFKSAVLLIIDVAQAVLVIAMLIVVIALVIKGVNYFY